MKMFLFTATAALAAAPLAAQKNWSFSDGVTDERWSLISAEYALCDAGLMQSPVDLAAAKARGSIALDVNFGRTAGTISLGEEKVQVDFPAGQGMVSGGKQFNLVQVHFHTPAEHSIDGERQPLVAHFVHATDDGELGVLGVMYSEGEANAELSNIMSGIEAGNGSEVRIDTAAMLPANLDVYRYMGSLTTPPCSEGVNWHVVAQPATASAAQIAAIRDALGGNTARAIQPLGARLLVAPEN